MRLFCVDRPPPSPFDNADTRCGRYAISVTAKVDPPSTSRVLEATSRSGTDWSVPITHDKHLAGHCHFCAGARSAVVLHVNREYRPFTLR